MYEITIRHEDKAHGDKEYGVLTHSVNIDDLMGDIEGLLLAIGFSEVSLAPYFDKE